LEGKHFLDFMAPEDAESFEALVSEDPVARKKHEQDEVAPETSVNLNPGFQWKAHPGANISPVLLG